MSIFRGEPNSSRMWVNFEVPVSAADLKLPRHFNWVLGNLIWGFVHFFSGSSAADITHSSPWQLFCEIVWEDNDQDTSSAMTQTWVEVKITYNFL